jgi:hypothetical protein
MRALVVGTNTAVRNNFSGANRRVVDIADFLTTLKYEVTTDKHIARNSNYDLICIVSYSNARQIKRARRHCKILWFDATDSWTVTHKSLRYRTTFKGLLRILRDILMTKYSKNADLVSFCSKRDADHHRNSNKHVFQFCHTQPSWRELPDFGERFVFTGPSDYLPNRRAVQWLVEVFNNHPNIKTKLIVFGSGYSFPNTARVEFVVGARDEELYGRRDTHLVPIFEGAGVKYKCLYPVALGLKTISTPEGANGLLRETSNLILAETKELFEQALIAESSKVCVGQRYISGRVLESDDILDIARHATIKF